MVAPVHMPPLGWGQYPGSWRSPLWREVLQGSGLYPVDSLLWTQEYLRHDVIHKDQVSKISDWVTLELDVKGCKDFVCLHPEQWALGLLCLPRSRENTTNYEQIYFFSIYTAHWYLQEGCKISSLECNDMLTQTHKSTERTNERTDEEGSDRES